MQDHHAETSRRTAIAGLGAVAVAAVAAACSRYGGPTAPPPTQTAAEPTTDAPSAPAGGGEVPAGIASTGDIPVGGGKVFADEELVITQPAEGDFKGFSALCKHQGCVVSDVGGGTINCGAPCGHGSKYKLDGSVSNGPAAAPLDPKTLKVDGDQISLG